MRLDHAIVERGNVEGRAEHQGPEVDGTTTIEDLTTAVGELVVARVIATDGVDLVARPIGGTA